MNDLMFFIKRLYALMNTDIIVRLLERFYIFGLGPDRSGPEGGPNGPDRTPDRSFGPVRGSVQSKNRPLDRSMKDPNTNDLTFFMNIFRFYYSGFFLDY